MKTDKLKEKITELCRIHNVDPDRFDMDYVLREASILDTKDNDPLLLMLIDFKIYKLSIELMRERIYNETTRERVRREIDSSIEVHEAKRSLKLIILSVVFCVFFIMIALYGSYHMGQRHGKQLGIAQAQNEELILKKRDKFAETELYRKVYMLYEIGVLDDIVSCQINGWRIKDNRCYPFQDPSGLIATWPMKWLDW